MSLDVRSQFFDVKSAVQIPKSVLDFTWINDVAEKEHVLFIAEGLFMYFDESEVKLIMQQIGKNFKHSLLAFNTLHGILARKKNPRKVLTATIKWGVRRIEEIEAWKTGLKQKQVFYTMNFYKRRWGWLLWAGLIFPSFKKALWWY